METLRKLRAKADATTGHERTAYENKIEEMTKVARKAADVYGKKENRIGVTLDRLA